jgi:hypothetical protein
MDEIRVVKFETFRCSSRELTIRSKVQPDGSWEVIGITRPQDPLRDPALFQEFLRFNLHRVYRTFVHAVQDCLETWYPVANFCIDLYCLADGYGWTPSWVRELWRELPDYLTGADLLIRLQDAPIFWELMEAPVEWWITPEWRIQLRRPHWRLSQSVEVLIADWWVKQFAADLSTLARKLEERHYRTRFQPAPLVVQAKASNP